MAPNGFGFSVVGVDVMRMRPLAIGCVALGIVAAGCSGAGDGAHSASPAHSSLQALTSALVTGSPRSRCAPSAVRVTAAPTGHVVSMHAHPYLIRFHNQSSRSCFLRGYPFVQLVRTRAPRAWVRILPTSTGYAYPPVVAGTASMLRPTNVGLTPRKSAFAYLVFSDGAECGASHSADLRVGLGRQSATVVRKINVEVCQGNGIYLSPFTTHRA